MSSIGHFLRSSLPQSYSLCHAQQSTSTDSATKSKTNFLAWCIYDEFGDKDWQKPERDWSIAVENVELTTDQLITTFRRKLNKTIKRDEVKTKAKAPRTRRVVSQPQRP